MRDVSKLSGKQRRQLMVQGDTAPAILQVLTELEERLTHIEKSREQEKGLRLPEIIAYFTKRIERIEKDLGLPKFPLKNPLADINRRTQK